MEFVYLAVKSVAILWILIIVLILMLGMRRSSKKEYLSQFLLAATMSIILPVIQFTTRVGESAPGAFTWGFPLVSIAGFLIFFSGIFIHFAGIHTLDKQWSTEVVINKDHKLIDTGIYAVIRNPIYAGMLLEVFGLGLAMSNWRSLLMILIPNLFSFGYRIFVEEKMLRKQFGDAYIQYARKTKRLIPGLF